MNILDFLAHMPPEAFKAFGRLLTALLAGDVAKAEKEARLTAQTIAIKRATAAAARSAAKVLRRRA